MTPLDQAIAAMERIYDRYKRDMSKKEAENYLSVLNQLRREAKAAHTTPSEGR